MAAEQDDLLLRIQSDVASVTSGLTQTTQGLQQLSDQFANLLNVVSEINRQFGDVVSRTSDTARGLSTVRSAADDTTSGFSNLQAAIVTANAALGLFNQVTGLVERGLGAVSSVTIGAAEQFGALAQHLQNASQIVGVSSQFYQELQARLERLGLGADSAQQAMIFFSRSLAEAREGNTALSLTFQRLGVDIERSRGTEAIFRDTAKAIAGMTDASQRTRVELELFFRSGARMTPVLMAMAKAGEDSVNVMERLGIVLSEDAKNAGLKFQDQFLLLTQVTEAFFNQIRSAEAEAFEPFIRTLAQGVAAMSTFVTTHREGMAEISKALAVFGAAVTAMVAWRIAVLAGSAAIGVLQGALTGLTVAEALATAGLSLLPGLLAAGATAAILYRDDLESMLVKVREWEQSTMPAWFDKFLAILSNPSSLFTPGEWSGGGGHFGGGGAEAQVKALEFTPDQLKKVQKSQEELQKALDAEAVKAVERSKGRAAAIEEQRSREVVAIQKRYDQERAAAQQQAGGPLSPQETRQYAEQQQAEIDAANAKARTEAAQVGFEQGNAIREQQIKAAADTARALVEIEKDKNKALFEAHKIGMDQYLATERDVLAKIRDIDETEIHQRMQLEAVDPAKVAADKAKLVAVEAKYQKDLTDVDDEGIKLREKLADEQTKALEKVAEVEQEAYGTPQAKRLAELAKAHEELVKKLQDSGLTQYIHEVDAAYAAMADKVKFGSIDIGSTITKGIEDAFTGVIAGTRKASEEINAFSESMEKSFLQWMAHSLEGKLGFDQELQGNLFGTIPGYAATGASKIGSTFSNLFNWLKGGTGTGPSVTIDETSASATGTGVFNQVGAAIFGPPPGGAAPIASVLGLAAGGLSEGISAVGFTPAESGAVPAEGGFTPAEGPESVGAGQTAFGGLSSGTGTESLGGGGGALGGLATAGITFGASIVAQVLSNMAQTGDWEKAHSILGHPYSQQDLLKQQSGGGIIGAIFNPLSKEQSADLGKDIGIGVFDAIFNPIAFLSFFESVPSLLQQIEQSLNNLNKKAGLPGVYGTIPQEGRPGNQDIYNAIIAGGFPEPGPSPNQELAQLQSQQALTLQYTGQTAPDITQKIASIQGRGTALANDPGIANLIGEALGVGTATTKRPTQAVDVANELINNAANLGLSVAETNREFLALLNASGITNLAQSLDLINQAYLNHHITLQQLDTASAGLAQLFDTTMTAAIDTTALAMDNTSTQVGKTGIDIANFSKDLQVAQSLVQGMDLSGAVGSALKSGNAGSFTTTLQSTFGTTLVQTISDAISTSPQFSSMFAAPVTEITEAAKALYSGDNATANADMTAAGDAMATAYQNGTDFLSQLMQASPALAAMVQHVQDFQDSITVLGNALSSALSPLTDPNTQVERDAQQQRINDLEYAISRAKAFGDEITASQLQMQLATEQAAQQAAGGSDVAAQLMAQIRQGVKQKVIDDLISALITSNGGILSSFMDIVAQQTLDMAANPANIAADMANIADAWQTTAPNLNNIMNSLATFAPQILNSFDQGGLAPGPMGMPQLAVIHGGERVLTPAQQESYSVTGPSVTVYVTGNTLLNARDLNDFAMMTGDVVLRQLKQNIPISHGRR